jgi:Ser/Thr protein kinase RdoA (MazF antagonist)
VADFAAAYSQIVPLEKIEIELLFFLVAARLVTTVVVTNWRALQHPHNSTYILRNSWDAWVGLEHLLHYDYNKAKTRLLDACRRAE